MEFHHVSILLEPCLEALQIKPDGVYVDATTGGAGHSLRIAERLHDTGRLICIDRDDEALENAKTRLHDVWQRVTTVKSDFREIDHVLESLGSVSYTHLDVYKRQVLWTAAQFLIAHLWALMVLLVTVPAALWFIFYYGRIQ